MQSENDSNHIKYYNSKGVNVPSCTTIVKLLNKPELVVWANTMGFRRIDVNRFVKERAVYGTACHEIAESYLTGIVLNHPPVMSPISNADYRSLISNLDALQAYFISCNIQIVRTEMAMHGEQFGGTLDMLCRDLTTGEYLLYDFKTSKRVYDSHFIQLAGYTMLLEELWGISVSRLGIILLSKNFLNEDFMTMKSREENKPNEEIFGKLVDIYWLRNKNNESK